MTEDRIPMATPVASTAGRNIAPPPDTTAGGVTMTAEATIAMARPAGAGGRGPGSPGGAGEPAASRRAEHDVGGPAGRGQDGEQHPGQVQVPVAALGQQHHPD